MLFGKRERQIRRILIVEDEPLVAFDNEHMLAERGYEIVATVDNLAAAKTAIDDEEIDLVLTDIELSGDGDGLDVARAAAAKGVAVLFVTGKCVQAAPDLALGCLAKPYGERVLVAALEALDTFIQGGKVKKLPDQLTLFPRAATAA